MAGGARHKDRRHDEHQRRRQPVLSTTSSSAPPGSTPTTSPPAPTPWQATCFSREPSRRVTRNRRGSSRPRSGVEPARRERKVVPGNESRLGLGNPPGRWSLPNFSARRQSAARVMSNPMARPTGSTAISPGPPAAKRIHPRARSRPGSAAGSPSNSGRRKGPVPVERTHTHDWHIRQYQGPRGNNRPIFSLNPHEDQTI